MSAHHDDMYPDYQSAFTVGGMPTIKQIKSKIERDYLVDKFTGVGTNLNSGKSDAGLSYHAWKTNLTNQLNTVNTQNPEAIGTIIELKTPPKLMSTVARSGAEARLKAIDQKVYSVARNKEGTEIRKSLADDDVLWSKVNAAATKAIALILATPSSDVKAIMTASSSGITDKPFKILQLFMREAHQRYKGLPFDIKQDIMSQLRAIGFVAVVEEIAELVHQTTVIMLKANDLLMMPNPQLDEATLQQARAAHVARANRIIAQNIQLSEDMQLDPMPPFMEPAALVEIDANSSIPSSFEIQLIVSERLDSESPALMGARAICEAHQATNTHWERTMEALTTFVAKKQPSLNQRFAMVRNHHAAQAQATSSSWVQHHESSQFEYPDLEEQSYEESSIDQATLDYQTYGDVPLQAAAAYPKRQKQNGPPKRCHFYNGITKQCERINKTGKCPFAAEGHFGNEPQMKPYRNTYPLATAAATEGREARISGYQRGACIRGQNSNTFLRTFLDSILPV